MEQNAASPNHIWRLGLETLIPLSLSLSLSPTFPLPRLFIFLCRGRSPSSATAIAATLSLSVFSLYPAHCLLSLSRSLSFSTSFSLPSASPLLCSPSPFCYHRTPPLVIAAAPSNTASLPERNPAPSATSRSTQREREREHGRAPVRSSPHEHSANTAHLSPRTSWTHSASKHKLGE